MSNKLFDRLFEKATSPLLLDVDWDSILKICDLIRQGDVQAKYVVGQIRKKMTHENIHVVNFALQCLESIVKNCGSKVHQEVASKDFMDMLKLTAGTRPDPIKSKILELIQCWSHAFKKNPNYKIVEDFYNVMKLEGFQFAALKEADAMFDVEEAPQWVHDSEAANCFRCRTEFSTLKRRHHCRACGQIFCHACSSKQAPIPKYGIEKEVRVCDVCFDKLNTNQPIPNESDLPLEYLNSALYKEAKMQQQSKASNSSGSISSMAKPAASNEKTEEEFQEELALALALSQSEEEAKKSQKSAKKSSSSKSSSNGHEKKKSSFDSNATAPYYDPSPSPQSNNNSIINSKYKVIENANGTQLITRQVPQQQQQQIQQQQIEEEAQEELRVDTEIDKFIEEVKKILELYINRMKSDSMRGRSITNDTAVQSLFLQLQHLQPKLMSYTKYKEDARAYYENLQDKLTQLKDAREALNALRQENFEKKRKEMEEKERLRQMQIAQKLQLMRQQKQSYYLYQNQLNLQRLQEQERDLQMRLNQQRELVSQRDQQIFQPPSMSQPSSFGGQLPPTYPGASTDQGYLEAKMLALQFQQQQYNIPQQAQPQFQQQPQQQQQQQWSGQGQFSMVPGQQMQQQQGQFQAPSQQPLSTQVNQQYQNPTIQSQQPQIQQQQYNVDQSQMYYNPNQQYQQQQQQPQQIPQLQQQQQPQPVQQNNVVEAQLISFD